MVVGQVHAVHDEPVVGRQRGEARWRVDVVDPLGDVHVDADTVVESERGRRLQRVVGTRERGMDADHPAATLTQVAIVLRQPAARPSAPWRSVTP